MLELELVQTGVEPFSYKYTQNSFNDHALCVNMLCGADLPDNILVSSLNPSFRLATKQWCDVMELFRGYEREKIIGIINALGWRNSTLGEVRGKTALQLIERSKFDKKAITFNQAVSAILMFRKREE